MATEATTYPKISKRIWWGLREKFKKSIPSVLTPVIVSTVVEMKDASARSNVINPMRELGLLDDKNKPTPLASRWRQDDEYPSVCDEIRRAVYPVELIEAFPEADSNQKDQIKNWFMKVGHVGDAAARMYTETFLLISDGDPTRMEEKPVKTQAKQTQRSPKATIKKPEEQRRVPPPPPPPASQSRLPAIHIDVQVHISPDTPSEQIDRIFESMSKHLRDFNK